MKPTLEPGLQITSGALKHAQDLIGAGKGHGLGDTALLISFTTGASLFGRTKGIVAIFLFNYVCKASKASL